MDAGAVRRYPRGVDRPAARSPRAAAAGRGRRAIAERPSTSCRSRRGLSRLACPARSPSGRGCRGRRRWRRLLSSRCSWRQHSSPVTTCARAAGIGAAPFSSRRSSRIVAFGVWVLNAKHVADPNTEMGRFFTGSRSGPRGCCGCSTWRSSRTSAGSGRPRWCRGRG